MIFLTVGTQLPFDRLVKIVDKQAEKFGLGEIYGQICSAKYRPKNFEYSDFLSPCDFKKQFDKAQIIIAHAGMGTILESLSFGKKVIVMPRLFEFGEHRNDHQQSTCEKLAGLPGLVIVNNEDEMNAAIDGFLRKGTESHSISEYASDELIDYLRTEIGIS